MGKGGQLKINFKRALLWCMRFLRRRITVLYGDNLPLPIKRLVKSEPMKRRSRSRSFSNKIRKSKSGRVSPRLLKRQTSNQARIFKKDLCGEQVSPWNSDKGFAHFAVFDNSDVNPLANGIYETKIRIHDTKQKISEDRDSRTRTSVGHESFECFRNP